MIQKIVNVPVTEASHPFATACKKMGFEEMGYIEEEYLFYGTSNIYENTHAGALLQVRFSDVPYCNRLIVRRPAEAEKCSGNVVVEILNATAKMDLDRLWVTGGRQMMRDGAVYVGITSKPDVFPALWAFDEERYAPVSWKYPAAREETDAAGDPNVQPVLPDHETGLFWDMLTDLGQMLRGGSKFDILPEIGQRFLYLTGWSQSAIYLYTYVNHILFEIPDVMEHPVYDGYFAAGGPHMLTAPLNQEGYGIPHRSEDNRITRMPWPFIAVQTESENALMGGYEDRQEDSDAPGLRYRCYEYAGPTHDTAESLLDYYKDDADTEKINMTPRYMGTDPYPNDFPYHFLFNATFAHLFAWVKDEVLPPHAPRIEVDARLENVKDSHGNAVGGVRSPFIDVPSAVYYNYSHISTEIMPDGKFGLFGHTEPFSAEKLVSLYGNLEDYETLVRSAARDACGKGYLLEADLEEAVAWAVRSAQERGLPALS